MPNVWAPIASANSIIAVAMSSTLSSSGPSASDWPYPGVSGAIGTIDASLDRFILGDQINHIGVSTYTLRILAVQGGNVYESISSFAGDGGSIWHSFAASNLTVNDFGLFSSSNLVGADFTSHPDFSGGPITFGFAMARGGTTIPFNDVLRADNFDLTINGAVPEPAAWTMMLAGFGGLGAAMRRRRRATAG